MTRTDIWMLAAIVAADMLQPQDSRIPFPFLWVGRDTCDGDPKRGPHRELCHGSSGTQTMLDFFKREFGFNAQQVVAIMGAHSVGTMSRRNSGHDAPAGWDLSNFVLDNGYYIELVGDPADAFRRTPDWRQIIIRNGDLRKSDTTQWNARVNGVDLAMLNTDIALVRRLNDGPANCSWSGANKCADASETLGHMIHYGQNRQVFLEDFRDALYEVIDNGYMRFACRFDQVCLVQKEP